MNDPILSLFHYQSYSQMIEAIRLQSEECDAQEHEDDETFAIMRPIIWRKITLLIN